MSDAIQHRQSGSGPRAQLGSVPFVDGTTDLTIRRNRGGNDDGPRVEQTDCTAIQVRPSQALTTWRRPARGGGFSCRAHRGWGGYRDGKGFTTLGLT
jgi:hypothetical protein